MHIRKIEFERTPLQSTSLHQVWLPIFLLVLLLAGLVVAMTFPVGPVAVDGCIG